MKNIFYLLIIFSCSLALITSCQKDDFAGPDAQVFGAIKDSLGGALVEQDIQTGSQIEVQELGFPTLVSQFWVIKNNGEYRNNLVFSNNYDIYMRNGNYFPYTRSKVTIKPGENNIDFLVVPFIRVKNVTITRNTTTNKIEATFKLEAGKPVVKLKSIQLYAFSDIYVGAQIKYATAGTGYSQTFSPTIAIDPATTYTLSIDLAANTALFKTGRDYYFRIGAMADVTGVGTIRTNYAPYVKISL
jgi:hypothetical protein